MRGNVIPSGGFLLGLPNVGLESHAGNAETRGTDNAHASNAHASSSQSSAATGQPSLVASSVQGGESSYVLQVATSDPRSTVRVHPNPDHRGGHWPQSDTDSHPASFNTVTIHATDIPSSRTMAAEASLQQPLPVLGQRRDTPVLAPSRRAQKAVAL